MIDFLPGEFHRLLALVDGVRRRPAALAATAPHAQEAQPESAPPVKALEPWHGRRVETPVPSRPTLTLVRPPWCGWCHETHRGECRPRVIRRPDGDAA